MQLSFFILLINLAATFYMVGLIWFVQLVHYPLFNRVGSDGFREYQTQHQRRTTLAVGAPMIAELLTSVLLVWYPPPVNAALVLLGIGLLFVIWVSTAVLQVPCHSQLERGFDAKVHRQLVQTNWIRTIGWSLRGVLVSWFALQALMHAQF